MNGEKMDTYKVFVGKATRKKTTRRPRCRLEGHIKTYLRGLGWCSMDWINLAQDKDKWRVLVNTVMNLRVS
jgi:hypothetical protein